MVAKPELPYPYLPAAVSRGEKSNTEEEGALP